MNLSTLALDLITINITSKSSAFANVDFICQLRFQLTFFSLSQMNTLIITNNLLRV